MNIKVAEMLRNVGIPMHIKGYEYIKTAILLVYQDSSLKHNITKGLYPKIAKMYDTTTSRVERAIRHAIEIAFTNGNTDMLYEIFGFTISYNKSKATNSQFIITMLETLTVSDEHLS